MRMLAAVAFGGLLALSAQVAPASAGVMPEHTQNQSHAMSAGIVQADWDHHWHRHYVWRHEYREHWHPYWHHHYDRHYGYQRYGY
ncbi:hypothetical protein [Acidisoma cladoniae]|jgi:hypothetical protein|uniref:hypothetical protein n=1 Tax=Acidisoma cladoniae TaxID=3040935 RepID=UPI00254DF900|nr:hypothetical protein [Acidisoma sp. PAMC 29798]